jgi:1-acyl-sn-glycerol-3-phosphate acyltransferase
VLTALAWRCVFACSFWIREEIDGLQELRTELKASNTGAVIIANHLSFLDTILLVALMPVTEISRVKMFVSSHLLKIPLLSTIVKAMGHLVVPFKSAAEGKFEVDKDLMAERQAMLETHVKAGGIAGWFPEGAMNPGENALEVAQFRAGGFSLAVNVDVPIWCVALVGNDRCWPRRAALGGRPSRIGVKVFKLCDHSTELAAKGGDSQRDQQVYLADLAHQKIQEAVDELSANGCCPGRECEP